MKVYSFYKNDITYIGLDTIKNAAITTLYPDFWKELFENGETEVTGVFNEDDKTDVISFKETIRFSQELLELKDFFCDVESGLIDFFGYKKRTDYPKKEKIYLIKTFYVTDTVLRNEFKTRKDMYLFLIWLSVRPLDCLKPFTTLTEETLQSVANDFQNIEIKWDIKNEERIKALEKERI